MTYHIVWCPKCRKELPVVVQKSLRIVIRSIAESRGLEVKELEVMADHAHLFIGAPPTESPVGIAKALKGISARVLFDEHPILRTMFRQGRLWSPSCHIGTVGRVSEEAVARYIRDQILRRVRRPASFPQ
ncbi:MAG: IS200/IS605 family transposase [Euryarchaeota archaeon]|nr:IS200/IS605 family transposase [Euryarchaeota archaeon]